jgi:GMP synthase-like glutamine amidotransferase
VADRGERWRIGADFGIIGTSKDRTRRTHGPFPLLIGILQTDSVLEQFAPRFGEYPDMFRALLADPRARPPDMEPPEFLDIVVQRGAYPDPASCDAYVITGSRHSVYDDLPWIPPLVEFLRRALAIRRRVVGICFGHQLIAHFFGGETRAADGGWCVGVQPAAITREEPWMTPVAERIALLASHKDQVARLPEGARAFAQGPRCPVAGFVMDDVLTFQGHPEFAKAYASELMDMREQVLGAPTYSAGKASLSVPTDELLVARWMLNFMAQAGR